MVLRSLLIADTLEPYRMATEPIVSAKTTNLGNSGRDSSRTRNFGNKSEEYGLESSV